MYKNFYTFKAQIDEIKPQLVGLPIKRSFTTRKNELIFDLERWHLRCDLSRDYPGLFLAAPQNYKSPQKEIFHWQSDESIVDIEIAPFDKQVTITALEHAWILRFFGTQPNCYFYYDDELKDMFKHYEDIRPQKNRHYKLWPFSVSVLQRWVDESPEMTVLNAITRQLPALNNRMKDELLFRVGCSEKASLGEQKLERVVEIFETFYQELNTPGAFIYRKGRAPLFFTLYPSLAYRAQKYDEEKWDSVNKAWSAFVSQKKRYSETERLKKQCLNALERKENALQQALDALREASDIEKKKRQAELKGNLLLTLMSQVPKGASEVELPDVINASNETVYISLDERKSVAENATSYFNKYKNSGQQKEAIEMKKAVYERDLELVQALKTEAESGNMKQLNGVYRRLVEMHLIQDPQLAQKTEQNLSFAFKRMLIDRRWELYIGKNSSNNDLLTFSFAHNYDIWLHARNVPGSHVILRKPGKNSEAPAHVLEKAARITAAHSRAKNDSTVAVMYTEKRYVSRIRKAQPGQVKVKNEKVVFVEPLHI